MRCELITCVEVEEEHRHEHCESCGAADYGNIFCLACRDWWFKADMGYLEIVNFFDQFHRAVLAARTGTKAHG